jgi:hypothetical protein
MNDTRLDELSADEWWDICRHFRPDVTRDEFDLMWEEFQEMKRRRELH